MYKELKYKKDYNEQLIYWYNYPLVKPLYPGYYYCYFGASNVLEKLYWNGENFPVQGITHFTELLPPKN
jgi:hypothetical protein